MYEGLYDFIVPSLEAKIGNTPRCPHSCQYHSLCVQILVKCCSLTYV